MSDTAPPSARQRELLELTYAYALEHGLTDLSLRPLAAAVGSSTRVLQFLFGSKDELVRAVLERARQDEENLLARLRAEVARPESVSMGVVVGELWAWMAAPERRPLMRLWVESYAQSLIAPDGPWAEFAHRTVIDWLVMLDQFSTGTTETERATRSTLALLTLRGALLDLVATDDYARIDLAVQQHIATTK
jgi:AcrR family transcriptional regulator